MYQGEKGYLKLMNDIMVEGKDRGDRTNTGTRSIFSAQLGFNLQNSFPALTTKKLFWKGVMGELLWFLSGSSSLSDLRRLTYGTDNGQKTIWDIDYTRWHKMNDRGVSEDEGGRLYGVQWRNFTSNYQGGMVVDQIRSVLDEARVNPESRRLLVNAWNAADIAYDALALPPCHFCFQIYIEDGKVNLKWSQRSCDVFLGVGFNIASYAMLTHIFAHWLGLEAGMLIGDLTNVHIYHTHFDAVREQLSRNIMAPPQAPVIHQDFALNTVDQYTANDFPLVGYESHPTIKAPMAG